MLNCDSDKLSFLEKFERVSNVWDGVFLHVISVC